MSRPAARPSRRSFALLFLPLAALCYGLIAGFYLLPMTGNPGQAIGGWIDARENYWNLWWARQALLQEHANPFQATNMQYPFGISLLFHTFNLANGILSLPFQLFGGVAFAYNMLNLLALVLAGSGMCALVWYVVRSRSAAFVAGLIYAFSPYVAFHVDAGQTNLIAIQWMPWYFLALLLGLRRHWIWLPVASILLLVNALTDWHYVVFLAIITAITALYEAMRLPRARYITLLAKLGLLGGCFVLLAAPVLFPMLRELSSDLAVTRDLDDSLNHSADLLAFGLPSPFHPLWGAWAGKIFYERLVPPNMVGGLASLGYATVLLALAGVVSRRRDWALFALIAAAGAVLALGPYLRVDGAVVELAAGRPVPLPYLLFHRLPLMSTVRVPSRFVLVTMFGLSVLAGMGVAAIWSWFGSTRRARFVAGLALLPITAVLLFEYWPAPFKTTPVTPDQVSPFYLQLGQDASRYAIADVPYLEARSMFFQTFHNKATLGARIARPKLHPWAAARFFGPLLQGAPPRLEIGEDDSVTAWHAALACQNVRYVVFYKDTKDARYKEYAARLEALLFAGQTPVYEDASLRAYRPPAETAREAYWTPANEEWYDGERNDQNRPIRWLKGDRGSLLAYPCGARTIVLRFIAYSYAIPRTIEIGLNGTPLQTIELPAQTERSYEIPLELRDGENRITFHSVQPATSPVTRGVANDTRSLSIMLADVSMRPQ